MDRKNLPGPGDEATWPRCTGNPLDPRTLDIKDCDSDDWDQDSYYEMLLREREGRDS